MRKKDDLRMRILKRLFTNFDLPKNHQDHYYCALEEIMYEIELLRKDVAATDSRTSQTTLSTVDYTSNNRLHRIR